MDCYENATVKYKSVEVLISAGQYQDAVGLACLAVELFLKSKLPLVDPDDKLKLSKSHDSINIFDTLMEKFPTKKDLLPGIKLCRKYFNDARYPFAGNDVYTEEFAMEFLSIVKNVKDYIDNECRASVSDLQRIFKK